LSKFEWSNLFNYGEKNSLDFNNINGITGIFGKNFSGKSSIIDAILFTVFNTTSKNERKNANVVNQNKDWGEGIATINVGEKVFTIHRKVEKYEKKSKGETSIEAKTHLDFSVYNTVTDETKSLNGTTRNQTDANIRKQFGTIDDFLISSMSSQHGALSFINEGSTKRKEIIAKFLDLQFFDKKFKYAKEDSQQSKALLRKMEGRDYKKEIQDAEDTLISHKEAVANLEVRELALQSKLTFAKEKVLELSLAISNAPTDVFDIQQIYSDIKKTKNKIISLSHSVIDDGNTLHKERERLSNIADLIKTLDYDTLSSSLVSIEQAEKLLREQTRKLEVATEKKKLLEDIPCGTNYPTCKFIRDAHVATAVIPEMESDIDKLQMTLSNLNPELVRDHINKYRRLERKQIETDSLIKDLQLGIEKKKSALERLNSTIEELSGKQELYNDNKEAIENLEKLIKEKELYAIQTKSLEKQTNRTSQEKINLYKLIGSEEQRIESIKEQEVEFQKIQSEYSAYDLFLRCMHPNGIAYDIIKQKLPIINEEIAKILSNVVDFEIFFETSGNKFDIFIKHPKHEARPIEMASGAEKTMAAMAIRLAMLSVSSLPTSDTFILDEPGTALDEDRMAGFIRILELIKVYFKNVFLISHLDSLKDCVDMQIVIDKNKGFAKVNQ
jgi:exonuclease SbcC